MQWCTKRCIYIAKWTKSIRNLKLTCNFHELTGSKLADEPPSTQPSWIYTNTGTTPSSVINFGVTLTTCLANISISFAASSFSSQLSKWRFFTHLYNRIIGFSSLSLICFSNKFSCLCLSSNRFRFSCKLSVVFAAEGSPTSFKGTRSTQSLLS